MTGQKVSKTVNDVQISEHHSNLPGSVNPSSFGKRLREERERLGLSQTEFAQVGGIGRTTQHIYETDIRTPDVGYLEKLRGIGVDVSYLVIGSRQVVASADSLMISYSGLLNIYRIVEEFCVNGDGEPLSLEVRARFFQLLCVSLKEKNGQDQSLDSLRSELRRLTGT
jgi:transcriptional regulator with XRE-family HTH domain